MEQIISADWPGPSDILSVPIKTFVEINSAKRVEEKEVYRIVLQFKLYLNVC